MIQRTGQVEFKYRMSKYSTHSTGFQLRKERFFLSRSLDPRDSWHHAKYELVLCRGVKGVRRKPIGGVSIHTWKGHNPTWEEVYDVLDKRVVKRIMES